MIYGGFSVGNRVNAITLRDSVYREGYLEILPTRLARAFWRVLDCWQSVVLLKFSRGHEARRFTLKVACRTGVIFYV